MLAVITYGKSQYLGVDRGSMGIYFGHQLYLAGVMMGSLSDIQPVQFLETAQLPVTRANMGIAAVVPAYKLREILFSDILNNRRGSDQ